MAGPPADARAAFADLDAFMAGGILAFETADTYRGLDATLGAFLADRQARGLPLPRIHARITLPADVDVAFDALVARLGGTVPDLVQIQMWRLDPPAYVAAAERLARRTGRIGLMNVDADVLARALDGGVRPLSVQAQLSPLDHRPLATLLPACRAARVHLVAYGALAGGFLTERWLGRPDPGMRPGPDGAFHREYRIVVEAFGGWGRFQALLAALDAVARRHGTTMAAVALRWTLDVPGVALALAGASRPGRLADWRPVADLRLDAADRAAIAAVTGDAPGPSGPVGGLERDPAGPFAAAIAAHAGDG